MERAAISPNPPAGEVNHFGFKPSTRAPLAMRSPNVVAARNTPKKGTLTPRRMSMDDSFTLPDESLADMFLNMVHSTSETGKSLEDIPNLKIRYKKYDYKKKEEAIKKFMEDAKLTVSGFLKNKDQFINTLRTREITMREKIISSGSQLRDLSRKAQSEAKAREELEHKLTAADSELTHLRKKVQAAETVKNGLERDLEVAKQGCEEAKAELKTIRHTLQMAQIELGAKKEELQVIQLEANEARDSYTEEISQLRHMEKTHREKIQTLEANVAELTKSLEEARDTINSLKISLSEVWNSLLPGRNSTARTLVLPQEKSTAKDAEKRREEAVERANHIQKELGKVASRHDSVRLQLAYINSSQKMRSVQ